MASQANASTFAHRSGHHLLEVHEAIAPVYDKSVSATLVLTVGLYVAARLWRLTSYSLRSDEIFSLQAARHDWSGLFAFIANDVVHPPLFYLLLKIWIGAGGESELWLRLFPVLTAVVTIWPFFLLCRELKLRGAEMSTALLLMAVNGYLIYYAQELRMYSLLLLLTVCSLLFFARFFNAANSINRNLIALFAVNLLLVYTQYFGWLVVGLELIFLALQERRKLASFSLSVLALILLFSPRGLCNNSKGGNRTRGARTKHWFVSSPSIP
jgi:uncharacterized membrane protein